MYQLDHVVLAAPDLDRAKREFETRTGVLPVDGGPHGGMGTRNALIGIDAQSYIEIIAPDPGQAPGANFGAELARLPQMELLHWAVRVRDCADIEARAKRAGLSPTPVRRQTRQRTDGVLLRWSVLGLRGHDAGGLLPFYIDWGETPHPAIDAPCVEASFAVTLPRERPWTDLLTPAPEGVRVGSGVPGMRLNISTRRGELTFHAVAPKGFAFG